MTPYIKIRHGNWIVGHTDDEGEEHFHLLLVVRGGSVSICEDAEAPFLGVDVSLDMVPALQLALQKILDKAGA